jgi:diguanylate cyclase (GGDEF)-like protein
MHSARACESAKMFNRVIHVLVEQARETNKPLSLCICDLDRIQNKRTTPSAIASATTCCSTFASGRARHDPRKSDFAARTGGDEFVLLLPDTTAEEATALAERVRDKFQDIRFDVAEKVPFHSSCSFGVAELSSTPPCSGFDLFESSRFFALRS